MLKRSDDMSAIESVWEHRLRQRITLERIILTVGNPKEQTRAKQFLEAMEKANPKLLEDAETYDPELFEDVDYHTPELFDASEYCPAKGRKTALKLPKDIVWEERIVRRAVREYRDLFHPCDYSFHNAMKGLQYLHKLHAELFARARAQAIEQRAELLTCDIYCKCDCTTREDRQPAAAFNITSRGRFKNVAKRIASARQSLECAGDGSQGDWQFFLDRVRDVAPEMLET